MQVIRHMPSGSESAQVSSFQEQLKAVRDLIETARRQHQRRALVLAGSRDWCLDVAEQLLTATGLLSVHWFSDRAPASAASSQGAAALRLLGTELDALVFDAWSGFDPDAFGALTGSIKGGGLLLLLTPLFSQWPGYADPQNERISVAPYAPEQLSGRFLTRLVKVLESDPGVMIFEQGLISKMPQPADSPAVAESRVEPPCKTLDQQRAVEAVIKVATGHRRRPVVLTSDRGRGKSAAFGIAAAKLIQCGHERIVLTGPRLRSVEAVVEHAHSLLSGPSRAIRFVAPDELLREPQQADLVLVDEAAAIPAPLLETLLKRYSRIAFATTVHGYEGTGRGFALRFSRSLDKYTNSWKALTLATPIRWAANDPLERLVFRMLSLDANAAADGLFQGTELHECSIECLNRDSLLEDERTLSELFGLLVQAHYRTRPLDLRHLLDGPNLSIYVLRLRQHIAGTALVAEEGGFDAETARAILAGERRPHGHLLPEALAVYQGLADAPLLRCARIMRIAVHPALQGRGLGARLVKHITEQVQIVANDYIGSSFGVTPGLLGFWTKMGWSPARLSIQRGASSGAHSLVMLKPLSPGGEDLLLKARQRFVAQFPYQLCDSLRDLDAGLVCSLMRNAGPCRIEPDEADLADVRAFAFEQRLLEVSIGSVWRWACHALMTSSHASRLDEQELSLLVARVLQKHSWQECAQRIDVPGRAQAQTVLRTAVAKLIR
jgi:tRNA(Met) cytidine acetyltransferase